MHKHLHEHLQHHHQQQPLNTIPTAITAPTNHCTAVATYHLSCYQPLLSNKLSHDRFLQGIRRTSNLLAPIMQLVGHGGEVLSMRFSPDGQTVASASADRTLLLWRTYDECENFMMLRGHKNAVLEVHWFSNGETLLSCSADKSVRCWDTEAGVQVRMRTDCEVFTQQATALRACAVLHAGYGCLCLLSCCIAAGLQQFLMCSAAVVECNQCLHSPMTSGAARPPADGNWRQQDTVVLHELLHTAGAASVPLPC
jgi:hypothetical protein